MLKSYLRTCSALDARPRVVCVAFIAALSVSLLPMSTAVAAGPAAVTVRVEGATKTLVPSTEVTTTTEPVVNSGSPSADSCPGTSGLGALQLATGGNWEGTWYGGEVKEGTFEGLGYSVETIAGESYPFSGGSYWDFWINDKPEEEYGLCSAEMQTGDQVLLFPCHYEEGKECPNPLAIEAPASANVDEPVSVTVKRYNAKGEASPANGATVTGASTAATTDSGGHATVSFSSAGEVTLQASASESVRDETTICVHNGNDGTCGTSAPSSSTTTSSGTTHTQSVGSQPAEVVTAKIAGVKNGHVYSRRAAPRLLKGSVTVPAGGLLQKVQISLKRRYRGHCYGFDGSSVRFVAIKCGRAAAFFSVGTKASFSYLLPARLPRGLYTFDIEAVNSAGQATKLVSGVSHVVFKVE